MSELWAIILGAELATAGGLTGTLFSEHLKKREIIYNDKKDAYIKLLEVINLIYMKGIDPANREQCSDEIFKETAKAQLYASKSVKKCYDDFFTVVFGLGPDDIAGDPKLEELKEEMVTQIQEDLGFKRPVVVNRIFYKLKSTR